MSDEDLVHLPNYATNCLHVIPAREGAFGKMIAENEEVLAELEVNSRTRIAVSAFWEKSHRRWGSFRITKIVYHKTLGWRRYGDREGEISLSYFDIARMKAFVAILGSVDLQEAKRTRIALGDNVTIESLSALLSSDRGPEMVRALSASPDLPDDIFALHRKRLALEEFKANLASNPAEAVWQAFFEANEWIFGHGLNYVFLHKVGEKLEASTTGATFDQPGKRVDALMRTRAQVSQYVLIEIKRSNMELLRKEEHRPGCFAASVDLAKAVTQVQKTVFEFGRKRFHDLLRDAEGRNLPDGVYSIEPRSYLVIGNLNEVVEHDDKIACFELFRRSVRAPEILTFDELYERARFIVDTLAKRAEREVDDEPAMPPMASFDQPPLANQSFADLDDEIPF